MLKRVCAFIIVAILITAAMTGCESETPAPTAPDTPEAIEPEEENEGEVETEGEAEAEEAPYPEPEEADAEATGEAGEEGYPPQQGYNPYPEPEDEE